MKNLSNRDLEWLCVPSDYCDEIGKVVHIEDNFAVGTDGYRLHAVNIDEIDVVENLAIKQNVIDRFDNNATIENVEVNIRYLVDALTGMLDERNQYKTVFLSIANNPENNIITVRLDDNKGRTAIVMCVENEDYD